MSALGNVLARYGYAFDVTEGKGFDAWRSTLLLAAFVAAVAITLAHVYTVTPEEFAGLFALLLGSASHDAGYYAAKQELPVTLPVALK
jgi:hypothetical protein